MANIFDDLIPIPATSAPVISPAKNIFDDIIPNKIGITPTSPKPGYEKFVADSLRNDLIKNKAEGKTFNNTIPEPVEDPVADTILSFAKGGTNATIPGMVAKAINKPMLSGADVDKAVTKHPIANIVGNIVGGAPTYAGLSMLGIPAPVSFGAMGVSQEALAQKEREANRSLMLDKKLTPVQSAGRLTTSGVLNAATGAVFHEADLAKNVLSGMIKAGFGAGANTLTEGIVKRAISGEPQNVPEDLKNSGVNALTIALGQGITRLPALRKEVWKAAEEVAKTKLVNRPVIKTYNDALTLLRKEGIEPEQLSAAWKEAKGIQSESDAIANAKKHIDEIATDNGWDKNIVKQVMADRSKRQLIEGYYNWLYGKGKAVGIYEQAKVSYGEKLAKDAITEAQGKAEAPKEPIPGEIAPVKPPITSETAVTSGEAPVVNVAPVISTTETDPARIQEIKNSISEGELILKSGKINERKLSQEELDAVKTSVDNAKAKIGTTTESLPKNEWVKVAGESPEWDIHFYGNIVTPGGGSMHKAIVTKGIAESSGKGKYVIQNNLVGNGPGKIIGSAPTLEEAKKIAEDFFAKQPTQKESVKQAVSKEPINEYQDNLNSFIKGIDKLKGKKVTRAYAFKKFDNALKPLGEINQEYAKGLGVVDNKVYSSQAYFISHHFNNHPNTTNEEYATLPEVLLNPDEVKLNNKDGRKGYVFIKKYDKYHTAIANVDIENNKIILHKTFFAQKIKPYKNLTSVELNVIGGAANSPSAKPQAEASAVGEISALPTNKNIPQEGNVVKGKKTIEYVNVTLTDEDKGILAKIREEVSKAQAGYKYVTRDEEGDVTHAGYEPGDFEFIPYWVKGWSKDNVIKIIDNAVNKGKLTIKQNEDLQLLLANYKEIANEEAKLKGEGKSQSEIQEADRIAQEEVGDTQEVSNEPGRVEEQSEVFPETKLNPTELYEQYYQEFISKKYSIPEAKKRAKAKLAEALKGEAAPTPKSEEKQQVIDGGVAGFGTQEKGQGELFGKGNNSKSPGAGAQASYYGTNIADFEAVGAEGSEQEFKLFEKVKALAKKYAERVGEKYTGRRAVGLFFPHTKNIFLRALNNMSVAIHEVTHYLDDKFKIVAPLREVVGETANGNPKYAKESLPMRKALTDVYEKYYPGGRRTHKLEKRLTEGIATFIQKYVEMPTRMTTDYPLLVKEFLSESGKYHDPILNDFIRDAREIIREYQQLDALSKVKSRVVSAGQISDVKSFLNLREKIYTEVADNIFPIEKLGGDIHLWVRFFRTISGLIARNIIGDSGYYSIRNGNIVKLHEFNWHTIIKTLHDSGETENFGAWLFARDTHFNYVELEKMKQNIANSIRAVAVTEGRAITEEEALRKAENFPEVREKSLELDKNGVTKEVAEKAYLDHKDKFAEEAKMFDDLTRADLDLLHDPQVGLVNYEKYTELKSKEGYASLKRDIYNEILGEPTEDVPIAKSRVGKTNISSMKSRHGSGLSVINPLFSAVQNHNEIIHKAIKQIVYNKVYKVRESFPGLFQQLPVETSTDKFGRIQFPQEKDPNIIMARENYKRKPLLVSKEIKTVLEEVLIHQKLHLIEEILVRMSRLFTKGTTGLYPQFAVSNFVVDQFTSAAQTKNNIIPAYTPLVELFKEVMDKDSPDATYFKEYLILGGDRQTLVGWLDMTPNEFFRAISQEKKGILEVLGNIEGGTENILGFASKWSEIITRASEYIKARKSGKSQLLALEEAGQVTAPFHHIGRLGGGTIGKTAIKMIPFFSPAVQVLAQYGRTLHDPKSRKRALFVMGILSAVMIGSMYWLRTKGTKKQKEAIKGIQPNELANYIWFPHPNGEDLLRFRIPEQMGVFGTMTNMLILDQMENAHYGSDEYLDAATAWIPDQLNITDPERLLVSWIPQLVRPALEVDINQRIYPKVTPLESSLMRELPPSERYTEKTSRLGRALGGKLGLSPIQWDHLIEGYLGRATRFAVGKEVGNPLIRETYTLSMRQVENYYEIKTKTEQQVNLMKKDPNRFTPEERNKIRSDYQKSQRIANDIRTYRDMSKKNNKDPRLDTYRTKILDGIDSLY